MTYSESLYTDPEDLKSIPLSTHSEILIIFPNSATETARTLDTAHITCGKLQEKLIMRHHENNKAPLGANANR